MFLKENILLAIAGLKANKMRSLLTMLGIIIGISSVISIVSIGSALSNSVLSLMSDMGAGNIYCGISQKVETENEPEESDYFSREDLYVIKDKFKDQIADIKLQTYFGDGYAKASGYNSANISIRGVNADFKNVESVKLKQGRFITEKDEKGNKRTVVVSNKLVNKLFKGRNPIGQELKVYSNSNEMSVYYVVGVYEYKQNMFNGGMMKTEDEFPTEMYIPITTAKENSKNKNYESFTIKPFPNTDSNKLVSELETYLKRMYKNNKYYGTYVYNGQQEVDGFSKTLKIVSLVISVIAAISLLVGGIGVMNIMLVSVTERTREIGTRKALGAKSSYIRMQFITEAVIICAIGGAIGITLGVGTGIIACIILKAPVSISISTILISLTFSMGIGVFFGYYPAKKASKLDPIEALRYE